MNLINTQGMSIVPQMQPTMVMERYGNIFRTGVAHAIADAVQKKVEKILISNKIEVLSSEGKNHLAHRLATQAVYSSGNRMMTDVIDATLEHETIPQYYDSLTESAELIAIHIADAWFRKRRIFIPTTDSEAYQQYKNERNVRNRIEPAEDRPMDEVPELLESINMRYQTGAEKRDLFERVRSAHYRPMVSSDAPRITDSYRSALLESDTLSLLTHTKESMSRDEILLNIAEFREKIKKGVFIWDVDEQELADDLNGKCLEVEGMEFRGRVLEDKKDGSILGWLTYKHAPHNNKFLSKQRRTVSKYLKRGVTDSPMQYDESEPVEKFLKEKDNTQLFQDIRCRVPFASSRLAALSFEEMLKSNPNLKYVFAYRLYDLYIQPELDFMNQTREAGILPSHNDKSMKLFNGWGFKHITTDYNHRESAKKSLRKNVGGIDRLLNPKWGMLVNVLSQASQMTREEWHGIQINYGDLSEDAVPNSWTI